MSGFVCFILWGVIIGYCDGDYFGYGMEVVKFFVVFVDDEVF